MAYDKETNKRMRRIPKEYKEDVKWIMKHYFKLGVDSVKNLLTQIEEIPVNDIDRYGVYHDTDLDGG